MDENGSSPRTIFQPPAISPAKPVPLSETSKPFPTPFTEPSREKNSLHRVQDGKIDKRKNNTKGKSAVSGENKDFVNANLRRMIRPKPPVEILGELAVTLNTVETYRFLEPVDEVISGQTLRLFPCEVDFNGGTFSGSAPDQEISKNLAAENAIQAFTVNAVNGEAPNPETSDPLDNAPWAALASLGLFKLFNDWQSRGFTLPLNSLPGQMRQQSPVIGNSSQRIIQRSRKKDPDDIYSKHPVSILNEVYPETTMRSSIHPNQPDLFQMTTTINGRTFVGSGRNKKDAKKYCAMTALKELMNIDYSKFG